MRVFFSSYLMIFYTSKEISYTDLCMQNLISERDNLNVCNMHGNQMSIVTKYFCGFIINRGIQTFVDFVGTGEPRIYMFNEDYICFWFACRL